MLAFGFGVAEQRGRAFDGDAQPATARFENLGVLDGRLVTRKADGRVFGSNECFEYMEVGLSARSWRSSPRPPHRWQGSLRLTP